LCLCGDLNDAKEPSLCIWAHVRTTDDIPHDPLAVPDYIVSNELQRKYGIDILVGRFVSDTLFECYLSIDAKAVSNVYVELFGRGMLDTRKNQRHFSVTDLQFNQPDADMLTLPAGEQSKLNNNHAQALIFISQTGRFNPIFIYAQDVVNAIRLNYIKGQPNVPLKRKDKIAPNATTAQIGNRQDMKFADDKEFVAEMKSYKHSEPKQMPIPQTGFVVAETAANKTVSAYYKSKPMDVAIQVGKERVLIYDGEVQSTAIYVPIPQDELDRLILKERNKRLMQFRLNNMPKNQTGKLGVLKRKKICKISIRRLNKT
jgi:hypothetical protein